MRANESSVTWAPSTLREEKTVHVRQLLRLAAAAAVSATFATSSLRAQAPATPAPQVTVGGVAYLQYLLQLKDTADQDNNVDVTRSYIDVIGRFSGGGYTRGTA